MRCDIEGDPDPRWHARKKRDAQRDEACLPGLAGCSIEGAKRGTSDAARVARVRARAREDGISRSRDERRVRGDDERSIHSDDARNVQVQTA